MTTATATPPTPAPLVRVTGPAADALLAQLPPFVWMNAKGRSYTPADMIVVRMPDGELRVLPRGVWEQGVQP